MNLDRLRYFCALARTSSVRQAADLLRLSPPALSKAVRILEEEVGCKLIAPSGRGIVLTPEGRRLAERAAPLIGEIEQLQGSLRESDEAQRPLRLASFEVFTTYFLGEFLNEHWEGGLSTHELVPGHMEEAIALGHSDVGITYLPIPHPELDHIKVAQMRMGIFGLKSWRGKKFEELPFTIPITPVSGSPNKVQGLDGWPEDKFPRYVKYRVELMESGFELGRRGLSVGYYPASIVQLHNKWVKESAQFVEIDAYPKGMKPESFPVYLVRRKGDAEDAQVRLLAKALRLLNK